MTSWSTSAQFLLACQRQPSNLSHLVWWISWFNPTILHYTLVSQTIGIRSRITRFYRAHMVWAGLLLKGMLISSVNYLSTKFQSILRWISHFSECEGIGVMILPDVSVFRTRLESAKHILLSHKEHEEYSLKQGMSVNRVLE